jgi:PBP1b-binding outer membrane lipoprotein LpoB
MKTKILLLLAVGALALAGCSTPSTVNSGPLKAHTFSFVAPKPKPPLGGADFTPVHTMVQEAITKNLAQKGLSKVPNGGDLTIAYLIIAGNNATTTTINDYFGPRDDATALHEKAQNAYSKSKNPNYFEAGTLVIDVLDPKTGALLRRHYASRPVLQNPTVDARAARIQEVVDEVLRDLTIEH